MQNSDEYDINLMCECLNVSRSGFYRFFYACSSGRKERKASICMRIVSYMLPIRSWGLQESPSCFMEKAYR